MFQNLRSIKLLLLMSVITAATVFTACGGGETVIETVIVKEKGDTVVETVIVVATPTPGGSTGAVAEPTEVSAAVDPSKLPDSKSASGMVTMAIIGAALDTGGGSLPDAPMGAGRQWGAGESLFQPIGSDWDGLQLAESWDLATDLSTVDITIRKGVKFHSNNGDFGELKAVDMAWVINRTNPSLNPESIAASAANFSALFGDVPVEAIDEYTIRGTFNNFDVRWASNILNQEASGGLTSMATPKKAFDDEGRDWLRDHFVGTGPFQLKEFKAGTSATFEKVPYDHWRKNASIDIFKVISVPEEATRIALLQTGEVDVSFIDPKDLAMMKASGYIEVSAGQGTQEGVMFPGNLWEKTNALTGEEFDFPSHGVFVREIPWIGNPWSPDDSNNPAGMDDMEQARLVRQALARGVDREAIVEFVLGGVGEPNHVTYFSTSNANWDSKWEYPYDVAKANSMLDEAGYPKDDDGIRFQIPLFVGPELGGGSGPAGEIGDAIAGFWQELGIDVQVLKYAYAVFRPGLVSRGTIVPMLTSCDDGKESYPFDWPKGLVMTSLTRGGFSCGFESPEILSWYQDSSSEPDRSKRIDINKEYAEYMHNWALFPGFVTVPNTNFANPKHIKEWSMHKGASYNSPENIVLQ